MSNTKKTTKWASGALAVLIVAAVSWQGNARAGSDTWDNTSGDFNWNTGSSGNWTISGTPGSVWGSGDSAIFDSTAIGTITVDPTGVSASALTFNALGTGYTLTGGTITLTGGVTNSATFGTNTISAPITTSTAISIANSTSGSILSLGALSSSGTTGVTFSGAGTTNLTGTLTLSATGDSLVTGLVNSSGGGSLSGANLQINSGGVFNISGGTFSTNKIFAIANASGTGATNVSAGTLSITSGGALLAGANNAAGVGTLTIGGTGTVTINSGAAFSIGAAGTGTVNLNSGGTLNLPVGMGGFAIAGSVFNFNGGTLKATAAIASLFTGTAANGTINVTQSGANIDTAGNAVTISNVLAHSGTGTGDSLTVSGTAGGVLTLNGVNTFSGGLTVNSGATVTAGTSASSTGAGGVTVNGTLNTTVANVTYTGLSTSLSGSGTVNVTLGTTTQTNALNGNYSGFTGTWNIGNGGAGGKVQMNGADNAAATINVQAGTASSGGTVFVSAAGTHNAAVVLNGAFGGGALGENLGQLRIEASTIWAGQVTLKGASTSGMIGGNGPATISGNIVETGGARLLNRLGSGTTILSGTNSYSGGTTVSAGGLIFAKLSALPSTGAVVAINGTTLGVNAGGTGEFGGTDIVSLLGRSTIGIAATAGTFQVDTTNASAPVTVSSAIGDTGGKLSLAKAGANTLVLNATNTYSGTTPVNAGTLALGPLGNLGATQVTVANGATFAVQQTSSGTTNTIGNATQTLSAGGTLSMADGFTSALNITGGVVFNGGTIVLDAAGALTDTIASTASTVLVNGLTTISIVDTTNTDLTPGTYTIISGTGASTLNANLVLASNKITVNGKTYGLSLAGSTATQAKLTISAVGIGTAYYTGAQGASWGSNNGGNFNWNTNAASGINAAAVPSAPTDVFFTTTSPTALNLTNTLDTNYTIGSLTFNTASAVTINSGVGTNTLTIDGSTAGGLIVNAGVQTINAGLALGATQTWTNSSASALTLGGGVAGNGFKLTTAGSGNFLFNGIISGTGSPLTIGGTGIVTLNAANTYTGATTVNSGATLAVTATSGLGSATVTTNSGTLILSGGNGTLGTLANTGGSALVLSGGTVQFQANGANTSGGVSTAYTSAANLNGSMSVSASGTVQLRSDSTVTFAPGGNGGIGGLNGATINFDVNQLTSAGSSGVLTFAPPASSNNGVIVGNNVTVNITGGNGYSLVLGQWTNVAGAGTLKFNPTTANVSIGALAESINGAEIFNLDGTSSNNFVTGVISNGTGALTNNVTKSNSSTWTLSGTNTFGSTSSSNAVGAASVTFSDAGTLNLANTSALGVTGGYVNISPTSAATTAGTLQLLTDAGFGTKTYNLWYGNVAASQPFASTIALGRATAGASNSITHNFGTLTLQVNGGKNVTLNVVPGLNASTAQDTLAFTGLVTGNGNAVTHTLVPVGENITIGTATNNSTVVTTLQLDGTSAGNAINGVISGAALIAINKANSSTWTISGANTYTGGTTLTAGTLNLNTTTALGGAAGGFAINGGTFNNTSGAAITMANANPITIGGSFAFGTPAGNVLNNMTLPGAVTNGASGRVITINGTGATLNFSGLMTNTSGVANTVTVNGAGNTMMFGAYALANAAVSVQDVFNGNANISIPGVVSNGSSAACGLQYAGSATLFLSGTSTFTGTLDPISGTVNVATLSDYGVNSAIGARASASDIAGGTMAINIGNSTTASGILQYTGSTAQTTNRQIRFSATTGNAIDASGTGSGTISFTRNTASLNLFNTGGARTLNLIGSNTGNNTFSIPLTDQATNGLTSLAKSGSGKWVLNTTQNYTGTTAINGGTLALGSGGNFGVGTLTGTTTATTAVTVNAGGTLAVNPGTNAATNTLGTATTASGATLTLNAGSAFTMSGDNAYSTFTIFKTATLSPASGTAPVMTFDISSGGVTNCDKLAVTGAATMGAVKPVIYINYIGGATAPTPGSYTIMTAASGFAASGASFTLGTTKIYSGTTPYAVSIDTTNSTATALVILIGTFSGATDQAFWTGTAGAAWNTGLTNFNTSVAGGTAVSFQPTAVSDVFFSTTTPSPTNLTNTLGTNYTINSLSFLSTAGAATIGGTNALTLNGGTTGNIGLSVASGSAAQAVTAPITLGGPQTWTNASTNTLTIGNSTNGITNAGYTLTTGGAGNFALVGALTGAGGLTAAGTGTVTLSATGNSYTGATTVRSGIVSVTGGTITATTGFDVGGSSNAIVSLTGGAVTIGNGTGNRIGWAQGINSPSIGTEYINGATVTGNSDTTIGWVNSTGGSATGNFYLTSGSFNQATGSFYTGVLTAAGTCFGTTNIAGGTFTAGGTLIGGGGGPGGAISAFNVNGGTVTLGTVNSANAGLATMNLGPGTTITTNAWTTGATNTFINFNGATYKSGVTANTLNTAGIVLYGAGGTINANSFPTTVGGAVTNAANSAVTALTVGTADSTTVFTSPPSLVFTGGGGSGGSGYATLNASGIITGAVITNGGSYTSAPAVTISGSTQTYTATLTNSVNAPLNLNASGTSITLSGTSTPTGPINITAGTVKNGAAGAFGTTSSPGVFVTAASAATLDVNGTVINGNVTVGGTGVGGTAGAITNSGAGLAAQSMATLTLTADALFVPTNRFEQRSSGTSLAPFNMNGRTLTISGGTNGTGFHLTGGLGVNIVNPGNIIVSNNAQFAPELVTNFNGTSANTLTLGSGTQLGTYALTGTTPWTINATSATLANFSATSTWTGPVSLTGSNTMLMQGGNLTFNGIVSGATGSILAMSGSGGGTLTLAGANTYSGGTTLNGGVSGMTVTGTGASPLGATTGALSVNNLNNSAAGDAVILNLTTTANTTTGSLSGSISVPTSGTNSATINNGGSGTAFTVNQASSGSYSGVIAGGGGFTLGIFSTSALTLSGTNTYTGATTLNAGTLALSAVGKIATASNITVNSSATLALASGGSLLTNTNNLVLSGGIVQALVQTDNTGSGGTITVSGGIVTHTFTSSGVLVLPVGVTASELIVGGGGGGGGGVSGIVYSYGGGGGQVKNLTSQAISAGNINVVVGSGGAGVGNGQGSNGSVSSIGGNSAAGGLSPVLQATLAAGSGGTSGSGKLGGTGNATSLAAGGGAGDSAVGGNASTTGGGNGGAGTIGTLTGATYGGGGGGTYSSNQGTGGAGGGGAGNVAGTANTGGGGGGGFGGGSGIVVIQYPLVTNIASTVSLNGSSIDLRSPSILDAGGSGGLLVVASPMATSTGSGGLTIASSNSAGGIVRFDTVAKTYAGATTITSNSTLQMNLANAMPFGTGTGNVAVSGTLDLNGNSTSINGLSGSGTIDTISGGSPTLSVGNNSATSSFGGAIQNTLGTLGLTKVGTGVLTLTGTSTYTGATSVSAGTLSGTGTLSGSAVSVSGGTLAPGIPGGLTGTFTVPSADFSTGGGGTLSVRIADSGNDLLQLTSTTATPALNMGAGSTLTIDLSNLTVDPGSNYIVVAQGPTWSIGAGAGFQNVVFTPSAKFGASVRYLSNDNSKTPTSKQVIVAFNSNVTPIKVDRFHAKVVGAGVRVEWNCVSEFQNAGFNIYRRSVDGGDWTPVNAVLIAGRITSADAKAYSLYDWVSEGSYDYKLESVSVQGEREVCPLRTSAIVDALAAADQPDASSITAIADGSGADSAASRLNAVSTAFARAADGPIQINGLVRDANGGVILSADVRNLSFSSVNAIADARATVSAPAIRNTLNPAVAARWFTSGLSSGNSFTAAKVQYVQPGVLAIPQASLPAGFDIHHVAIQREGRTLPILAIQNNALVVYAPGYNDDYTNKDALFVRSTVGNTSAGNVTTTSGLFGGNRSPNTASLTSVTASYHDVYFDYGTAYRPYTFAPWFSSQYLTSGSDQSFAIATPHASAGPATLTVNLWSLTSTPGVSPDHALQVLINGQPAGQAQWTGGNAMMQLTFQVPSGVVNAGANTINLVTPALNGVSSQICFLHSMTMNYTRALDGSQPVTVTNSGGASALYELGNLPGAGAWVVDTRFPDRAALVPYEAQQQADGTFKVRFNAAAGGTGEFLVVPFGQENAPTSVTKNSVKAQKSTAYMAVGPIQFNAGVQPLLTKHAKEGLRGAFINQEQVFDYYNYGRYGPAGIQSMVRALRPQYLLLVGRTTYDYLNYSGANVDPLCPAFLVSTTFWAQTTSDSLFGDLGRGYPEVAVGRLPITTAPELAGAVQHILNYNGAPVSGVRVHAVADQTDPLAGNFPAQADGIAAALPDLAWQPNYLGVTYNSSPEVTAALTTAANGGADWLIYVGHGNAVGLGNESPRILDTTSVQSWKGNTVLLQSTCTAHWMAKDVNDYKSIAIQALTQPQGGIAAGVGTSTYMNSDCAVAFMTQLMKTANAAGIRWGDALMKTQQWASQQGSSDYGDLNRTEQLFGDPAMPVFQKSPPNTSGAKRSPSAPSTGTF